MDPFFGVGVPSAARADFIFKLTLRPAQNINSQFAVARLTNGTYVAPVVFGSLAGGQSASHTFTSIGSPSDFSGFALITSYGSNNLSPPSGIVVGSGTGVASTWTSSPTPFNAAFTGMTETTLLTSVRNYTGNNPPTPPFGPTDYTTLTSFIETNKTSLMIPFISGTTSGKFTKFSDATDGGDFDLEVSPVPEPGALLLLGSTAIVLGLAHSYRRRRTARGIVT